MKKSKTSELTLKQFFELCYPRYKYPIHLQPLIDYFEAVDRGDVASLVMHAPVRHGKTTLMCVGIVWLLHRHPDWPIAYITYGAPLTLKQCKRMRGLAVRTGLALQKGSESATDWATEQGGGLFGSSVGGAVTGMGFRAIFVDDPLKGRAVAESKTQRDSAWDFLEDDVATRCEPDGTSIALIAARWHDDDPSGRALDEWDCQAVRLPAIDDRGRALWPDIWPADCEFLVNAQKNKHKWASLFQGEPVAKGDYVFDGAYTYRDLPEKGLRWSIGIDMAYSEKTHADYSVAVVMAYDGEYYYIVRVLRVKCKAPVFALRLKALCESYQAAPRPIWHATGPESGVADMIGAIDIRQPIGSKFSRWQPLAAEWGDGKVLVPQSAPWLDEYLEEMLGLTGIKDAHDDCGDASASAFDGLQNDSYVGVI